MDNYGDCDRDSYSAWYVSFSEFDAPVNLLNRIFDLWVGIAKYTLAILIIGPFWRVHIYRVWSCCCWTCPPLNLCLRINLSSFADVHSIYVRSFLSSCTSLASNGFTANRKRCPRAWRIHRYPHRPNALLLFAKAEDWLSEGRFASKPADFICCTPCF